MSETKIEMMEKLMVRNNQISLGILAAMVTFVVLMFTFITRNSAQHQEISNQMLIEQQYTHNIYKYVINPNDSIVKVLIIDFDKHVADDNNKHAKIDSTLSKHNSRIYILEKKVK